MIYLIAATLVTWTLASVQAYTIPSEGMRSDMKESGSRRRARAVLEQCICDCS